MYGSKTVRLFEEVKDRFDPDGVLNPGKIVRPPRMDDRALFRFKPDYRVPVTDAALEWPGFTGAGRGLQGAVEMCNNNGACRKFDAGVMCPSYRVTRDERDVTRGRANTLRLALSGQIDGGLGSDELLETLKLCVSCKGCRRECPTGVDMAKMKIEVLAARNRRRGLSLHDRLVAYLPRYAPWASRMRWLANARDGVPGVAALSEHIIGFSAKRALPRWASQSYRPAVKDGRGKARTTAGGTGDLPFAVFAVGPATETDSARRVALFADTFNTYFEPDNLHASSDVLRGLGYAVEPITPTDGGRPVCCGRTFLAAGLVDEARTEARRLLAAVMPALDAGLPIVGIEPSCLLTLRDEWQVMGLGDDAARAGDAAVMLEELIVRDAAAGRIVQPIGRLEGTVHVHGHCHQKSFGLDADIAKVLTLVDGLTVRPITSSCCGMAGAFGYGADTHLTSLAMGELSLFPAVRAARRNDLVAADGFSCRHQIRDGTGRTARHVALILRQAMAFPSDDRRIA
jgi:Fe-S oxidoreductase